MLFLCVVIVTPALVRGHEFYVSPDGDDASTGSFAAPFRTLQKCVDAAQSQSKDETANGMANGASIVLSSMATVAAQRLLHAGLWGAFCNWRSRVCSTKGEPSVAHKGASTLNAALGMDLERVQMEMMERGDTMAPLQDVTRVASTAVGMAVDALRERGEHTNGIPGQHQCTMRQGRYPEPTTINKFSIERSILIQGYAQETPVIDGSDEIKIRWRIDRSFPKSKVHGKVCTFRSDPLPEGRVPWQLWVGDEFEDLPVGARPLTPARWPNARLAEYEPFIPSGGGAGEFDAEEVNEEFNAEETTSEEASTGAFLYSSKRSSRIEDGGVLNLENDEASAERLRQSGIDFTDTMLVQAYGSMLEKTTGSFVRSYNPATGSLTFELPAGFQQNRASKQALPKGMGSGGHTNLPYFFEGHPKLLDSEEEWSYDASSNTLLAWLPGCVSPNQATIRGRFRDISLEMSESDVTLQGIELFGTTFSAFKSNLVLDNVVMAFPTFNKRTIGDGATITQTVTDMRGGKRLQMMNSAVYFADAPAVFNGRFGDNAVFVNNLFKGGMYGVGSSATITSVNSPKDTIFQRNSVLYFNSCGGISPGPRPIIEHNHFGFSGVSLDGAAIHVQRPSQSGSVIRWNWVHDTLIKSIRFDRINTAGSLLGEHGTITNNVCWDTGAIMVKGDHHTVNNNVIFNSVNAQERSGSLAVMLEGYAKWGAPGENLHTTMTGNIADSFITPKNGPAFPDGASNNLALGYHRWWDAQFTDAARLDFRPRPGSECATQGLGAYTVGLTAAEYLTQRPGCTRDHQV